MYRRRRHSFGNIIAFVLLITFIIGAIAAFLIINFAPDNDPVSEAIAAVPAATSAIDTAVDAEAPDASALSAAYDGFYDARIQIPAAGVNTQIVQAYLDGISWDVSSLGTNVGHLQGTMWMGQGSGNIVLSGHVELSDGRSGIFSNLDNLQAGDLIILRQGEREQRYVVAEIRNVEPDDLTPLYPTETDQVTLITCDEYNFLSDTYQQRTIVVAERIS